MLGKKSISICVGLLAVVLYRHFAIKLPAPIVKTKYGEISGVIHKSRLGRNYFSYMGIPYSLPPIGNNRFEPPAQVKPWKEIYDGTSLKPNCLQFDLMIKKVSGDENCLYLNIYVPETIESRKPMKTMVFFHGGIFIFGSGNAYNPEYWMDSDVIIVTVNYRLGALGFLNTMDGKIRGNNGLRDQVMALQFVQDNIEEFGGSKDSVCIFGESAGAVSVHLHMLSPLSKGLFQCAISQSGNAPAHWAINDNPRKQAIRFAEQLNCPTSHPETMVNCLKKVDPKELVEIHQEILRPLRDWITLYGPTIESDGNGDPFLPAHPLDLMRAGKFVDVPYLIGVNSQDGMLVSAGIFRNETMIERLTKEFNVVASNLLNLDRDRDRTKLDIIHTYYADPGKVVTDPFLKFENYTNLFSDRMFFVPAHQSAELHAKKSSNIYLYYYSYPRDQSLANIVLAIKGRFSATIEVAFALASNWIKINIFRTDVPKYSMHADELALLFPMPWSSYIKAGHKDFEMSRKMINLWTSFGDNGKHPKFGEATLEPVKLNSTKLKYFNIGLDSKMIDEPFYERIQLWNSLTNEK